MIITHSRDSRWLSNTWLIGDRPGGHAVIVDTGGPMQPIVAAIEAHQLTLTHVLCTHHHHDHVAHNADYRERYGCPVCGHAAESDLFGDLNATLADGDELESGDLRVRALHIPGHTTGQLAFLVDGTHVLTGDTLFRGSVGGTRGPGHGTFAQLQHSIMDVLMKLPPETTVLPGHMEPSTVAREFEENPFVRAWRGLEREGSDQVLAAGRRATLLLEARDYDGGTKAWVRFEDSGELDLVPGSRVERS
jgi:hydroxyacylglutathione hydrolase